MQFSEEGTKLRQHMIITLHGHGESVSGQLVDSGRVVWVAPQPLERHRQHLGEVVGAVVVEPRGPGGHAAALRVPRRLYLGQDRRELPPRQVGHLQILKSKWGCLEK